MARNDGRATSQPEEGQAARNGVEIDRIAQGHQVEVEVIGKR